MHSYMSSASATSGAAATRESTVCRIAAAERMCEVRHVASPDRRFDHASRYFGMDGPPSFASEHETEPCILLKHPAMPASMRLCATHRFATKCAVPRRWELRPLKSPGCVRVMCSISETHSCPTPTMNRRRSSWDSRRASSSGTSTGAGSPSRTRRRLRVRTLRAAADQRSFKTLAEKLRAFQDAGCAPQTRPQATRGFCATAFRSRSFESPTHAPPSTPPGVPWIAGVVKSGNASLNQLCLQFRSIMTSWSALLQRRRESNRDERNTCSTARWAPNRPSGRCRPRRPRPARGKYGPLADNTPAVLRDRKRAFRLTARRRPESRLEHLRERAILGVREARTLENGVKPRPESQQVSGAAEATEATRHSADRPGAEPRFRFRRLAPRRP